jgi:dolichol-phosphate mannosyltransferase
MDAEPRNHGPVVAGLPTYRVFASFVVLADDDGEALPSLLRRVDALLGTRFDRHELIVVDNRGDTATADAMAALHEELSGSLVHMVMARSHDTERAMLAGLSRAMGDFVFETSSVEADWTPALLVDLFERCASGVDIVDASSHRASWARQGFFRSLNRFSHLDIPDAPTSVRVVSRRALNAMLDMREKVRYRRALYAATGFPHATLRFDAQEPGGDRPERGWLATVGKGFDVMVSFSDFGLRLANLAALFFAGVAIAALLYTIAVFALKRDVAAGWTTLMLLMSFGLAGIFIVLSLLGEYVARVLVEVRQRPPYNLRSVTVYPSHTDRPQPEPAPLEVATTLPDDGPPVVER